MASLKCYVLATLALMFAGAVKGQPLDWPPVPYSYVAQGESLRDLLVNFGANYQGSVIVSDKINETVSGSYEPKDPEEFLSLIGALYGLMWYYDGAVLYVFKATEMQSRIIKLKQVKQLELRQALEDSGIWEERFGWKADAGGQLIYVSGPLRYLELVEQTAQALDQQKQMRSESTGDLAVEIFVLKYAVAEDRQIKYRDETVAAPGVATVLSRVLSEGNVVSVDGSAPIAGGTVAPGRAVVQAEPSLNAVIVRDSAERMPMYKRLIAALDRPSARIEVGLSIVDINAENLAELGVDWQVGVGLGPNRLIDIRTTGGSAKSAVGSLVDGRGLNSLMAKVTLLQSQGRAQIGSRPTLLTQENTLAVIDHSETYYLKVSGEKFAELRSITYGTMLKMTPRLIQVGEQPEISLSLHIEDGNQKVNSAGPDGLPTISRTVIDTVARVGLGQSLLIGGIHRDELNEYMRKVPLLGDIPYMGALFRFTTNTSRRSVRLFLIEPRLIDNAIGRNVAFTGNRDFNDGFLKVDELSNKSVSLQSLLKPSECRPLASAQELQQVLKQAGKGSSLSACGMSDGTSGWRVDEGACTSGVAHCVRSVKR